MLNENQLDPYLPEWKRLESQLNAIAPAPVRVSPDASSLNYSARSTTMRQTIDSARAEELMGSAQKRVEFVQQFR